MRRRRSPVVPTAMPQRSMAERRQCPISRQQVLLAPTRQRRPHDYRVVEDRIDDVPCPFCPGAETASEVEYARIDPAGQIIHHPPESWRAAHDAHWQARAVANRYPAVGPSDGLGSHAHTFGQHEVIIESPRHDDRLATLGADNISGLLLLVRSRYRTLLDDDRIAYATWFRNEGSLAGGSLRHPHAQLLGSAFLPDRVRQKEETLRDLQARDPRCPFEALLAAELQAGDRVVARNAHAIVICPWAPRTPFETWILPRAHCPDFRDAAPEAVRGVSQLVAGLAVALERVLGRTALNAVLHSAPPRLAEAQRRWRWHMEIVPRQTALGGFELGAGVFIHTMPPETAADALRAAWPAEENPP